MFSIMPLLSLAPHHFKQGPQMRTHSAMANQWKPLRGCLSLAAPFSNSISTEPVTLILFRRSPAHTLGQFSPPDLSNIRLTN